MLSVQNGSPLSTLGLTVRDMVVESFGGGTVDGGAIRIEDASSVTLERVFFNRTRGETGGGLSIDRCSDVVIQHCSFVDTTATVDGGAVALESFNHGAIISNCTFTRNTADGDGGSVY
ncbi:unnamed protein product, partial [Ectocarpus fasciculatus]